MTKEDKELLLQDLCARLPYTVKVCCTANSKINGHLVGIIGEKVIMFSSGRADFTISDIRPYLRTMSSMTKKEKKDFLLLTIWDENDLTDIIKYPHMYEFTISIKAFDWLNKNHFDYRGLIQRGLAIKVTKDNNPYK